MPSPPESKTTSSPKAKSRNLPPFKSLWMGNPSPAQELLRELIDQWMIRNEATATKYGQPSAEDVDRAYAEFVKQFPSPEEFEKRCAAAGLTEAAVRRMVAQQLYLSRFIDYRFRPSAQVTDEQVEAYYQDEFAPQLKARNQPVPPLDDVDDTIREVLIQRAINERATKWLDDSRDGSADRRHVARKWLVKRLWRWLAAMLLLVALLCGAAFLVLQSGALNRWIRNALVRQIEARTGARVELARFSPSSPAFASRTR